MPDMTSAAMASPKPAAGGRLSWLDASRVFAALGVMMIHCSSDTAGNAFQAYPIAQRVFPVSMRIVGELSGSELFLIFSLFVLAMKHSKPGAPDYGATIRNQARRLLIPFAVWSGFYLAFRYVKAGAFGYTAGLVKEMTDWHNWVDYGLMGSAQYHLHFLPTLFAIMLFYPVMMAAFRFPLIGLVLVPLLFCMDTVQNSIWAHISGPFIRDLASRAVKIICYTGYGFAAFAICGLWRRGLNEVDTRLLFRFGLCLCAIAFLTTFAYAANVIMTGLWVTRPGAAFYAHFCMPALIFLTFLGTQNYGWAPVFSRIAKLNFGVYLVHPVFIDLYDIALFKSGLHLPPAASVSSKYVFVAICAFSTAFLLSKSRPLAWLIGLGDNFAKAKSQPAMAATAAE